MKFDRLGVLLPCRSLEDFSLKRKADEAEQVLSAWSALWHPSLVASAQRVPTWFPATEPPASPAGYLMILPQCGDISLPDGWVPKAEAAGARVLADLPDRPRMVAAALELLEPAPGDADPDDLDSDLVADFLALGFCYFQVELLTRQLRYMSNLDEESFKSALLSAAEKAIAGDGQAAREKIQLAFDLLHEGREYFYPVEAHLLDLTLVAPSTLGENLRAELADALPGNLLISGETIAQMAQREPETLAALVEAIEKGKAAIIGGEFTEAELPLLGPETIRRGILKGLGAAQEHLGTRPLVFGRRRFGLSPVLPQILKRLGFTAAVHGTLDDGRFPTGNQSRLQWEGLDGTTIEALARVPLDVSRADAFLRLPQRLGDAMDLDHVASVVLAHWPGHCCRWYEDLRRIAAYSPVLGTFRTIDDYFRETAFSGQQKKYSADQYRAPYLKQAVTDGRSDPISRWVRYFRRLAVAEALETLDALSVLVAGRSSASVRDGDDSSTAKMLEEVDRSVIVDTDSSRELPDDLDRRLQAGLDDAAAGLGRVLTGAGRAAETRGYLAINPSSFSRRLWLETPDMQPPPDPSGPVRAVEGQIAVVDVPAMGFAWVGPGSGKTEEAEPTRPKRLWGKKKKKEELPLAEENVLRNDFFEVAIDPHTGAIRSIKDYASREARVAQQIALRMPDAEVKDTADDAHYSIMTADDVRVTCPGPMVGEIVTRGRLVDRSVRRLAGFTQTTRVRRGSRVIELEIELDTDRLPSRNPWHSYYAVRFAWGDATANLYRSVNLANVPTDAAQLEAPHFLDIRSGKVRTTILTGGLPYHRRFGLRKLDTLLIVHGETARRFRLGVGIDLPHPMHGALEFLAPRTVLSATASPPTPSGWLFHLDVRNVIATHWEPLLVDGRVHGFRTRLLETDGRAVRLGLRSFRPPASAQKINPGDKPPTDLSIENDRVAVQLRAHEWAELEVRFTD